MSDSTSSLPIAGWYPDPENAEGERWWNGASWSDHRRPKTVTPPAPAPTAAGPLASPPPAAGEVPPIPVPPVVAASVDAATPAVVPPVTAPAVAPAVDPVNPYAVPNPYAAPTPYSAPAYGTPQPYAANPYAATTPYGYGAAPSTKNTVALVGMIISLVALLLSFYGVTGIAGGIVSIVGLQKSGQLARAGVTQNGRGQAIAGIIVGFGGAVLTWIIFGVVIGLASSYNSRYGY